MATVIQAPFFDEVLEMTKAAQEMGTDPLVWGVQLSSILTSAGVSMPSTDVANLLVSHICWGNNVPQAWKFLDKALTLRIVPPMLVLALLSIRVIPYRKKHPAAYRLYLELLKRYAFSLPSLIKSPNYKKIMESIDDAHHLSQVFGFQPCEPGVLLVEFLFSIVWELLDASLDDEGLLELTTEKQSIWAIRNQDMEIDNHECIEGKRTEHCEVLQKMNTVMAVEIIGEFFQNKATSRILYLTRRNMSIQWEPFNQHLRLLIGKSSALNSSKYISPQALLELTSKACTVLSKDWKTNSKQSFHAVMASGSLISAAGQCHGTSHSTLWLPIDLFFEDAWGGLQVAATSAVERLTGLVKALQALNRASWQDTFLAVWIAALRLVQRESDMSEGPVPRPDTCLCMLLSITPLAIVNIIEEEENFLVGETDFTSPRKEKQLVGSRRQDHVVSLQKLTDYEGLLTPPLSVSSSANQAAARAMLFLSGLSVGSGYFDGISLNDMPSGFSGNLQHLIVEACITRNILDNSAYLWPGYVKGHTNQVPRGLSGQMYGWSSFVKGSPLTPPMVNVLVSTPASSLAEIEKIYDIAVNGPDDDKISAATILCGASLNRGWNIQEHALLFITRLMCPPVPANYSGTDSHLIGYAPFINVLLVGLSSYDCVQIFSLHGLVPQLAGALMPICEAFGSCAPNISWTLATGEEISTYAVFSNAFTLLLRLWRFDQSPFEHVCGEAAPVGSHVSPEYLLLVRNMQLATDESSLEKCKSKRLSKLCSLSCREPIFLDSFPKLKNWYRQHQACIASTLSGLVPGTPIHQIVDALLAMMFRRINRGAQPIIPATSGSSNSSGTGLDDFHIHLKLPAWDILEAVPFVLDAVLTACGHGTLSPRELATGLKDLADFLPASLATIVSYFSAEVTRGLWKSAFMNGSDWPSPAANLAYVENQIKKILADTGVEVPRFPVGGNSPATLPLPLAALVSVTITYKLDSETDRYLNLVGPSLTNLATSCPWPCMAIVFALWAQKAKRWSDFLIFCVSRAVFHHNSDAVVQLLKVCFATTLGLNSSSSGNGGVGSLLGHGFGSHTSGGFRPIAPGVLFLRVHHAVRKIVFITEEIVSLLLESVKCIASSGLPSCNLEKLKKTKHGTKYGQVSLAAALTRVKVAASLGASIVWITGGSNLVQSLIKETLPSWFISVQRSSDSNGGDLGGGMVDMLGGYALAYFAVLSGTFAWGLDSTSSATKRRAQILGQHLEFLADALDGKFSLGCNKATWRAYVSGFLGLMVVGTPIWIREVNVDVLKRLSKALKQWNEVELALALLEIGGVPAMGAAAEMIIETGI